MTVPIDTKDTTTLPVVAANLGIGKLVRHIFLCADATKPKCAGKEESIEVWEHFEETPGRGGTDGRRPVYIPDNIDSAGYFEKQIVPGTLKRHFPMSDKDLVDYCEYYLFEGVFIASGRSYKTFVYEGDHTARIMGPILKCSSLVTRDVLVRACIALIWSFDILERIDIPRDRMPIETGLLINWLDAQVGDLAIGSSLEDLKATVRKLADGAGSGVRSGEE